MEKLVALGFNSILSTPDEFTARIKVDIAKWANVIKAANIKISDSLPVAKARAKREGPADAGRPFALIVVKNDQPLRALSMNSVLSATFQSGIVEIFFSCSSASAWCVR